MTEGAEMAMSTQETLLAFSEWLDSVGLIASDQTPDADTRTHDSLARDFIQQWEAKEGAATLAGRPHTRGQAPVDPTPQDDGARHPATQHLARQFSFEHLKTPLRQVSQQCHDLAAAMIRDLPDGPELSFGLRQLLLAKDAFVRAALETARSSH